MSDQPTQDRPREEPPDDDRADDDRADDDRDVGWGEDPRERDDDERFLRERPPHW